MASVKLQCPKCIGTGIVGSATASVCPQCTGTGTIMADDTQTLASVNTTASSGSNTPVVVTAPVAIPTAALKVTTKGK